MSESETRPPSPDSAEVDAPPDDAASGEPASNGEIAIGTEELAQLRRQLAELQSRLEQETAQATDYMHRWQRSAADFINYKRRAEQERDESTRFANQALVTQLLAVLDNFERAFMTLPRELLTLSWVVGVHMLYQQLHGLLMQQGLEPVHPKEEERYDPQQHEAIAYEPATGKADGTIVSTFQTGYRMHSRLLRPALVRVAQGDTQAPAPGGEAATIGGSTDAATPSERADDAPRRRDDGEHEA